jgi:glycerol-3-phosphate dehydrogenase (NAD(P)+)
LAITAHRAGRTVSLWAREPEVIKAISDHHENPSFLPGVPIDPAIRATGDLAEAADADALLVVVPSQFLRPVCRQLAPHLRAATPLVICAKGVEARTGALMSEVAAAELPDHPLAVLSGPTFAAEVARGLPTAITLAVSGAELPGSADHKPDGLGPGLARALSTPAFRPYLSDDVIGAEVGGAVKNVIAIACGVSEGLALGANARAALITRGLAEMTRFALAKAGRAETLMGLSGLGDLTLTCNSTQSRNFSFGKALGEGRSPEEILAGRSAVVEGVGNAASISAAAAILGVQMPICQAVNGVLHEGMDLDGAIRGLLDRPLRGESPALEGMTIS